MPVGQHGAGLGRSLGFAPHVLKLARTRTREPVESLSSQPHVRRCRVGSLKSCGSMSTTESGRPLQLRLFGFVLRASC